MTSVYPSLAVAIPTKNRPDDLEITIEGVLSQTVIPKQLIIVDQSADNKSQSRIFARYQALRPEVRRSLELVYIRDTSITGGSMARNRALDHIDSEIILFLDDDVTLENRFLEELLIVYKNSPGVSGVSGIVTNYPLPPLAYRLWSRLFMSGVLWDDRQPIYWRAEHLRDSGPIHVSRFGAGLMSFRANTISDLRFDEQLHGVCDGEDVDFCTRLKPGAKLVIAPKARLVHNQSQAGRSAEHWLSRHARTNWYLYCRNWNRGLRNRLCFMWLNIGYALMAAFVSIRRCSLISWAGLFKAIRDSHGLVDVRRNEVENSGFVRL